MCLTTPSHIYSIAEHSTKNLLLNLFLFLGKYHTFQVISHGSYSSQHETATASFIPEILMKRNYLSLVPLNSCIHRVICAVQMESSFEKMQIIT